MNYRFLTPFVLFAIMSLCAIEGYGQYTLIPDSAFEARLIQQGIDTEALHDGQILTADAASTTVLKIQGAGVLDYTGIEAFTNLQTFWPTYDDFTTLDLSQLTQLIDLRVTATQIDSIDLSQNTLLQTLYVIAANDLTEIDLSHNLDIMFLLLGVNNITSLDVSALTELRWLKVQSNPIDTLDLSGNPNLTTLEVQYTNLTSLDVSNNPALYDLDMSGLGLSNIDLSNNSNLTYLNVSYNDLQNIDVSHMTSLSDFFCIDNQLLELDLSSNIDLYRFNGSQNSFTSLNVQNGFNQDIDFMIAQDCPDLNCIQVDDPLYSDSTWISVDEGVIFSTDCGTEGPDCTAFTTAPTDLNKSFNPVNGVHDRVQLKWYKGAGQIRYSVEDNAACDIQYWAYRSKLGPEDDWNTIPLNERDTLMLPYTTVKKTNGRELFKWPLKYRLNNGTNQVQPNHGYRWRVRCYCDQGELVNGVQEISPWSEEKFFNTPDFDPLTGIYTPVTGAQMNEDKAMDYFSSSFDLFPNPSQGNGFYLDLGAGAESYAFMTLVDLSGREVHSELLQFSQKASSPLFVDLHLETGVYLVSLKTSQGSMTKRLLVTR